MFILRFWKYYSGVAATWRPWRKERWTSKTVVMEWYTKKEVESRMDLAWNLTNYPIGSSDPRWILDPLIGQTKWSWSCIFLTIKKNYAAVIAAHQKAATYWLFKPQGGSKPSAKIRIRSLDGCLEHWFGLWRWVSRLFFKPRYAAIMFFSLCFWSSRHAVLVAEVCFPCLVVSPL